MRRMEFGLLVSGGHLHGPDGGTIHEVEADGFPVLARIPLSRTGDEPVDVAVRLSQAVEGFASVLERERPEVLLLLGDRYEVAAAALAALPFLIPVGHVAGGEVTVGAFDDHLRHCITKLSHLHFVSHPEYARRVMQLGEEGWRVHVTGSPSIDALSRADIIHRERFLLEVGLNANDRFILFTFHPETLEYENTLRHARAALDAALSSGLKVLATAANADTWGMRINDLLSRAAESTETLVVRASLGSLYPSAMHHAEVMVGNSSSGIVEAAWFGLPVVNVGTRQDGRIRGGHVKDVPAEEQAVSAAIEKMTRPGVREELMAQRALFGDGKAAARICDALEAIDGESVDLIRKVFVDRDATGERERG